MMDDEERGGDTVVAGLLWGFFGRDWVDGLVDGLVGWLGGYGWVEGGGRREGRSVDSMHGFWSWKYRISLGGKKHPTATRQTFSPSAIPNQNSPPISPRPPPQPTPPPSHLHPQQSRTTHPHRRRTRTPTPRTPRTPRLHAAASRLHASRPSPLQIPDFVFFAAEQVVAVGQEGFDFGDAGAVAADLGVVVYEGEFGGFARGAAGEDLLGVWSG